MIHGSNGWNVCGIHPVPLMRTQTLVVCFGCPVHNLCSCSPLQIGIWGLHASGFYLDFMVQGRLPWIMHIQWRGKQKCPRFQDRECWFRLVYMNLNWWFIKKPWRQVQSMLTWLWYFDMFWCIFFIWWVCPTLSVRTKQFWSCWIRLNSELFGQWTFCKTDMTMDKNPSVLVACWTWKTFSLPC